MSRSVYRRLITSDRRVLYTSIARRQHSDSLILCHLSIDIKALEKRRHKPDGIPQAAYMLAEHAYFTGGYGPRISAD